MKTEFSAASVYQRETAASKKQEHHQRLCLNHIEESPAIDAG